MGIALGVGLTSACSFNCRHCYSGGGADPVEMDTDLLFQFISRLDVDSVNLGTGESHLHPEYHSVIEDLCSMGIPVAITTAGPSVEALSDKELRKLHDVDFSLDFPVGELHDDWRAPGAFDMVIRGIERCRATGVTASVAMCLMAQNAPFMEDMCLLCRDLGVALRINAYKPVHSLEYMPDYDAFWKAVDDLFRLSVRAVSSEPVVNAALAEITGKRLFPGSGSPCGSRSLRLRPGGGILPCVYWNESSVTMKEWIAGGAVLPGDPHCGVPGFCEDCPVLHICRGGCAGRRLYTGLDLPDAYCFHARGRRVPELTVPEPLMGDGYVHASYLCTMIGEFR